MSDVRRVDDRIEFSLRTKSALGVLIGIGLSLVLCFALGVAFGKQLATPRAATPLTYAKREAPATGDELEFTFHRRLINDPQTPLAPPAAPKAKPEKAPAPKAPERKAESASASQVPTPTKPEPSSESMAKAEPRSRAGGDGDTLGHAEPSPQAGSDAKKAESAPAANEATLAERSANPEPSPTSAQAEVPSPSPSKNAEEQQAPQDPPKPSSPSVDQRYSVQFAAAPNMDDANRLQQRLKASGIPAYVVEVDIPEKGRFYRVRAGRFANRESAKELLKEARAAGFDGLVMH